MNIGGIFKYIFFTVIFVGGLVFFITTLQREDSAKMDTAEIEMDIDMAYNELEFATSQAQKERILAKIAKKEKQLAIAEGEVNATKQEATKQYEKVGEEFKNQSKDFLSSKDEKEFDSLEKELNSIK